MNLINEPDIFRVNLNADNYNTPEIFDSIEAFWNSNPIDMNNSTFTGSFTIMKTICYIFDIQRSYNTKAIVFTDLNSDQRHKLYIILYYLNFNFIKNFNSITNKKEILVDIFNCWIIPIMNVSTFVEPWTRYFISRAKYEAMCDLYNSLENHIIIHDRYYSVTMHEYVKYWNINNNHYPDTNQFIPFRRNNSTSLSNNSNSLSNNTAKKLQLSDMIFDIKDDITDLMFKTIMEKLAEL